MEQQEHLQMGKLTQKQVANSKPGRLGDKGGSGLILETSPTLKRRWLIRFSRNGKVTESALGLYPYVTLAEARTKAFEVRRSLAGGSAPRRSVTFSTVANDVLEGKLASFKQGSSSHRRWAWTLRYATPLNDLDVAKITTDDVIQLLTPLYKAKPQTADRVRAAIETVLNAAKVRDLRTGENP